MKNRVPLIGSVVVVGAIAIGGGVHHAAAQQQRSSPRVALPGATSRTPGLQITFAHCHMTRVGQDMVGTLQGDVRISGGPVSLSSGPDELTIGAVGNGVGAFGNSAGKTIMHVPMNLATLRVTVTPSGTVFQDGQGNRLTVTTAAPGSVSSGG